MTVSKQRIIFDGLVQVLFLLFFLFFVWKEWVVVYWLLSLTIVLWQLGSAMELQWWRDYRIRWHKTWPWVVAWGISSLPALIIPFFDWIPVTTPIVSLVGLRSVYAEIRILRRQPKSFWDMAG